MDDRLDSTLLLLLLRAGTVPLFVHFREQSRAHFHF